MEDYKDTVQEEFFVQDSDVENDALRNIAAGRFLCEDVLEKIQDSINWINVNKICKEKRKSACNFLLNAINYD